MANMITAIQDRLVLTLDEVKGYLGIDLLDLTQDDFLNFLMDVCKRSGDDYCLNPFLAADGVTELDIPPPVKLGVMVCIKFEFNQKDSDAGVAGPIIMKKAGDLTERYSDKNAGDSASTVAPLGARRLWRQYRLVPGF